MLGFLFSLAMAQAESSLTLKSIEFCLGSGPVFISKTSDPRRIEVVFDNVSRQPRAFSVVLPNGASEISLNDAEFVGQFGKPLGLRLKDDEWVQEVASTKVTVPTQQMPELAKPLKRLAEKMRARLMTSVAKSRPYNIDPAIDRCHSGLQTLISNYSLQGVLTEADKATLKSRLFPEVERQPRESQTSH